MLSKLTKTPTEGCKEVFNVLKQKNQNISTGPLQKIDHTPIPWNVIACPYCLQPLKEEKQGIICVSCNSIYNYNKNGQLDFRLTRDKTVSLSFVLGSNSLSSFSSTQNCVFDILSMNPAPECKCGVPDGTTEELASYIPKANSEKNLMLDLGCGDTRHKSVFEQAGFNYVGLDYDSMESPILGDAHALPFKDNSFDFVFSRAVLEHLQYPFLAVNEAFRILKPNCRFIGTVAFLEPFHGNSYYHHTHLGLLNWLKQAGFQTEHISPNPKWDMLRAQAEMSLFPRMPSFFTRSLVAPLRSLHKTWWKIGGKFNPEADERRRLLLTAGSFMFVALKK